MSDKPYTHADVQLVAEALAIRADPELSWAEFAEQQRTAAGFMRTGARAALDALTAAGWVRMDPDEPHLIEFRPDGWTIQHPVRCRPNLFACPVNRVAGEQVDGPPASGLGVYECDVDDGGTLVLDYSTRREDADA
jgi:hypothetical protein